MVANERIKKGLKYNVPKILQLKHAKISEEEKQFFKAYLDVEKNDTQSDGILAISGT